MVGPRWWETVLHSQRRRVSQVFETVHVTLSNPPIVTRVAYAVWLMHRRKDLWGPDGMCKFAVNLSPPSFFYFFRVSKRLVLPLFISADLFDPMRFLDERVKVLF